MVTRNGQAVSGPDATNAVVGVWSTTERRKLEVTNAGWGISGAPATVNKKTNKWVQVSRLGNPLVNEVVIPLGMKDKFNRTTPDRDAELYGKYATKPELAAVLNALFDINAPETDRTDIVQALLHGHPGPEPALGQVRRHPGGHAEAQPGRAAVGEPGPLRRHRRRHRRVPERPPTGRRRGRHRAPGRRRLPRRQRGAARRRRRPGQRRIPSRSSPTSRDPESGFDSNPGQYVEPAHPPVPAGG